MQKMSLMGVVFSTKQIRNKNESTNQFPADICLLKVNNENMRTRCRSSVFIVNFEHI